MLGTRRQLAAALAAAGSAAVARRRAAAAARLRRGRRSRSRGGPSRAGRRRGVLAHQREPDPGLERQPGAHRRPELVRLRDAGRDRARPVGAGLPHDHQRHRRARLQHDPHPLLQPDGGDPDRAAEPRVQQQLRPDQHRPQGPERAPGPAEDRHRRRAGRAEGHPRRPPLRGRRVRRAGRPVVHQHLHQPGLGQRLGDAGEDVRGQPDRDRVRPAQRAAHPDRRHLRPGRHLGHRRRRPPTSGSPTSRPATRSSRWTRTR